jgi:hypothetical protein
VNFNGNLADAHSRRGLLVQETFNDVFQDFAFALAKRFEPSRQILQFLVLTAL